MVIPNFYLFSKVGFMPQWQSVMAVIEFVTVCKAENIYYLAFNRKEFMILCIEQG